MTSATQCQHLISRGVMTSAVVAAALVVGGCASLTRSHFASPELPVAAQWASRADGPARPVSGSWWDQFGDAQLSALVNQVLSRNADLAAAGIRLRRARMATELAATQLFPDLGGNASTGGSHALDGNEGWSRSSSASLGASWELDLFGRLDAERDAARWEAEATTQDLAATRLSLAGTTVKAWWQLGYANQRIELARQTLDYTRKTLELVQLQYRAGAVSRLELRDAEQSVAAQQAALAQLVQARTEARNALAALLDQQVYDGAEPATLPDAPLPEIDAGVPSELLARRPDLAAGEQRLRKALASKDATVASFYPQLSLTGTLGTASNNLLSFLTNPAASLGAALSLPFLNPAKVRLNTGIARADYEVAIAEFRQDFYDAMRDTANALSAREQYIQQGEALARNYAAARDAEALYQRRYRAGAIALRDWLDAIERLRNAESSVIENRLARLNAQVALYQALGGDAAVPRPDATL